MSDHNFNTPPELLDRVRLLDPYKHIGLDPCSNAYSMVDAISEFDGDAGYRPNLFKDIFSPLGWVV